MRMLALSVVFVYIVDHPVSGVLSLLSPIWSFSREDNYLMAKVFSCGSVSVNLHLNHLGQQSL